MHTQWKPSIHKLLPFHWIDTTLVMILSVVSHTAFVTSYFDGLWGIDNCVLHIFISDSHTIDYTLFFSFLFVFFFFFFFFTKFYILFIWSKVVTKQFREEDKSETYHPIFKPNHQNCCRQCMFLQTTDMLKMYLCCKYFPLRLDFLNLDQGTKKHLARVRMVFWLKMSWVLLKNREWFHAYNCWNTVLN